MTCDECATVINKGAAASTVAERSAMVKHVYGCNACEQVLRNWNAERPPANAIDYVLKCLAGASVMRSDMLDPEYPADLRAKLEPML